MPVDPLVNELVSGEILKVLSDDVASRWGKFCHHLCPRHFHEIRSPLEFTKYLIRAPLYTWITLKPKEATIHNLISVIRSPRIADEALAQLVERDSTIQKLYGIAERGMYMVCDWQLGIMTVFRKSLYELIQQTLPGAHQKYCVYTLGVPIIQYMYSSLYSVIAPISCISLIQESDLIQSQYSVHCPPL